MSTAYNYNGEPINLFKINDYEYDMSVLPYVCILPFGPFYWRLFLYKKQIPYYWLLYKTTRNKYLAIEFAKKFVNVSILKIKHWLIRIIKKKRALRILFEFFHMPGSFIPMLYGIRWKRNLNLP